MDCRQFVSAAPGLACCAQEFAQDKHRDVTYELERYPEDKTEPRLEKHGAPAIRYPMKDLLAAIDKPGADIELGCISTVSCILANNALKLGPTYRKPWIHPEPERVRMRA